MVTSLTVVDHWLERLDSEKRLWLSDLGGLIATFGGATLGAMTQGLIAFYVSIRSLTSISKMLVQRGVMSCHSRAGI